jgi:tetratricopeptide (TPR) repeat protein
MTTERIAALLQEARLDPENPARYRALATAHRAAGDEVATMAADLAAEALEARAPLVLYNLATACFQTGRREDAKRWYDLTLRLDPALVPAHRNLAAILENEGRLGEARHHYDEAYRRQSVFEEKATNERQRVLLLAASGYGNVPIDNLFPRASVTRIQWVIDYAKPGEGARLPAFDLVFNASGDPDMAGPLRPEVEGFLVALKKPLLNPPAAVARTQRQHLPALIGAIPDVVVPTVARAGRAGLDEAARRVGFPLILRPAGAHGGRGVSLIERPEDFAAAALGEAEIFYLTRYHDYRSPDAYFRKYRMIFVDREPYPYHLAISQHWLVHYFSADMLHPAWKRQEEERFLAEPRAALGRPAMAALTAIARRLDLDFCGIDFAIDGQGRVLVFEANATMLVHLADKRELFPYKHQYVPRIFEAFTAMVARRLGAQPCAGKPNDTAAN